MKTPIKEISPKGAQIPQWINPRSEVRPIQKCQRKSR